MGGITWKAMFEVVVMAAALCGYIWYKQWLDWSFLKSARGTRSRVITLIEVLILLFLILLIFVGLPRLGMRFIK